MYLAQGLGEDCGKPMIIIQSALPVLDSDSRVNHLLPLNTKNLKIQPSLNHISPPLYSVLFLQSLRSISAVPAMTSSSSLASKTDTSLASTTCGVTRMQSMAYESGEISAVIKPHQKRRAQGILGILYGSALCRHFEDCKALDK